MGLAEFGRIIWLPTKSKVKVEERIHTNYLIGMYSQIVVYEFIEYDIFSHINK